MEEQRLQRQAKRSKVSFSLPSPGPPKPCDGGRASAGDMSFSPRTSDRCQITRATRATCKSRLVKFALFGSKTGDSGEVFYTFFRVFSLLWDFFARKPLPFKDLRRSNPFKKNRAKKPTVGFWFFPLCATMEAMIHNNHVNERFLSQETEKSRGPLRPSAKRLINTVRGRFK
jgi:hypothetical protein